VFVTGAAIQWLRDGLGLLDNAGQSEALARSVPDSGGVVFVPALTGLGAPDWDPSARGAIFGLTRGTTRAHLIRAALEAIAFEVRDVVDVMTVEAAGRASSDVSPARPSPAGPSPAGAGPAGAGASPAGAGGDVSAGGAAPDGADHRAGDHPAVGDEAALRVDGGASANDLLLQLQADQLQRLVERPVIAETTALGAASLAGLATGVWSSRAELAAAWQLDRRFTPGPRDEAAHARWRSAVERTKGWA
jgi:glycerol kinase